MIGLILLATWGIAAFISAGGADSTERLAPVTFRVGGVEARAETIAEDGPLIFPGLDTTSGERTLVLDHEGTDADERAGACTGRTPLAAIRRAPSSRCAARVSSSTATAEQLDVTELAPAEGVRPIVENRDDADPRPPRGHRRRLTNTVAPHPSV